MATLERNHSGVFIHITDRGEFGQAQVDKVQGIGCVRTLNYCFRQYYFQWEIGSCIANDCSYFHWYSAKGTVGIHKDLHAYFDLIRIRRCAFINCNPISECIRTGRNGSRGEVGSQRGWLKADIFSINAVQLNNIFTDKSTVA